MAEIKKRLVKKPKQSWIVEPENKMEINISEYHIRNVSPDEYGINRPHYSVLLSHLSTHFNDSIIVDLGTRTGDSAVALAYNNSNRIYTYDIAHSAEAAEQFDKFDNIKYIIGNCLESNWNGMTLDDDMPRKVYFSTIGDKTDIKGNPKKAISDKEIFLSSKLIFLDIDPHDGKQEKVVTDFLIENNWKGIMVCDDIGTGKEIQNSHPDMLAWWNNVDVRKYNIADSIYSAGTGTGIICFDDQKVII